MGDMTEHDCNHAAPRYDRARDQWKCTSCDLRWSARFGKRPPVDRYGYPIEHNATAR